MRREGKRGASFLKDLTPSRVRVCARVRVRLGFASECIFYKFYLKRGCNFGGLPLLAAAKRSAPLKKKKNWENMRQLFRSVAERIDR